jgi:uncharacterized membrane protein YidH (DUF202 family)
LRKNNALFVIGLVLLIAGAATLVYGIIEYNRVSNALFPALGKALTGTSEEENRAVLEMIVGGAIALVGFIFLAFPRFRRRR